MLVGPFASILTLDCTFIVGAFVVPTFPWALLLLPLFACFPGQSDRLQFFQWLIIWRDDEQWGTEQSLFVLQFVMWFRTSFIVLQCGRVHLLASCPFGLSFSRFWHLCACKTNTNCCWINFLFSALVSAWHILIGMLLFSIIYGKLNGFYSNL